MIKTFAPLTCLDAIMVNPRKTERVLSPGEVVIDTLGNTEDEGSLRGKRGRLSITNMRIIWVSTDQRDTLSIGYSCVVAISVLTLQKGRQALKVSARSKGDVFEFIFSNTSKIQQLFASANAVFRSFLAAAAYRTVTRTPTRALLDRESVAYEDSRGLTLTTHRLLYARGRTFASVPWLRVLSLSLQSSTIAVKTDTELSFEIGNANTFKEACKLCKAAHKSPDVGVRVEFEPQQTESDKPIDDVEVSMADISAAYRLFQRPAPSASRPVVVDGLCFETNPTLD